MMQLREAATAMHGELRGPDTTLVGVSTDTRTLAPGELFFALKGERFDAAQFVERAFGAGAAAAVVGRDSIAVTNTERAVIVVDDARAALGRLAAHWRGR